MITKAERGELRSLIRQRFKVLRADVEARKAELLAELEQRMVAKYTADDKAWDDAMYLIAEVGREANRKANDIFRGLNAEGYPADKDYNIIAAREISRPTKERSELRKRGIGQVEAQVKAAFLELDRQEADVLTKLVVGALESDEARAFLGEIPTVSSLIPAGRLLALVGPVDDDIAA